jgi:hypothetical protein
MLRMPVGAEEQRHPSPVLMIERYVTGEVKRPKLEEYVLGNDFGDVPKRRKPDEVVIEMP